MQSETRTCQNCKGDFIIEPEDFNFYEKIKVPPPTFCPDCRRQRRWAWRNNMSLYNRTCELCGKGVVSIYHPDSGLTIYCNKCWWSDKWDPYKYGQDFDFSRPFFPQFKELLNKVPMLGMQNDDGIASVNSEYAADFAFSKNCYLTAAGWYCDNIMYSYYTCYDRDTMDSFFLKNSERCYECFESDRLFDSKYCYFCFDSMNLSFCYDMRNCQNCFMCTGLRGKKYCFKNEQYTKEEYEKILENYRLDTYSGVEKAKKEFEKLLVKYPRRCSINFKSVNTTGELTTFSKNSKNCFVVKNAENVRYSDYSGSLGDPIKDSFDLTMTGGSSENYECVTSDHSQLNFFAIFSVKSQDIRYCQHCHNCKHCFGCVGMRNANYCIFNKQYTKEEYNKLVAKIILQMNNMPYKDKRGIEYKYGEFYPIELSYFGYNESCAMEQFSLTKEETLENGYNWQDNTQRTTGKETLRPEEIPESIYDVDDSILDQILLCINCQRNFKIVQNELNFYRKMKVPIPRRCFYCRHANRIKNKNPFKLWHRTCMKEGCNNEFETSYAPDRPEIVYCEKCYQAEIY